MIPTSLCSGGPFNVDYQITVSSMLFEWDIIIVTLSLFSFAVMQVPLTSSSLETTLNCSLATIQAAQKQ